MAPQKRILSGLATRPVGSMTANAGRLIEALAARWLARAVLALAATAIAVLLPIAARADALAPVKLGISKLGAMTDVWIADKNGLFKKHGLDLQIVDIPLTSQSIQVLQSKSVDISLQIPGAAFQAKEQGFDVVLIGQNETAGTTPPVSNALIVPMNSPVASIKELAGKRLASPSPHGQSYAALKELFQRAGVAVAGVQFVMAPFPAHADLLRSGQVDAVVALDPYTTQIVKSGYGRVLSWFMIETVPDQPVGSWWVLGSWANQHPHEIGAFQDAIKEAQDYLNVDPVRAKKLVAEYTGLDPELVKGMSITWKSKINPAVWQAVADMMYRQGELQKPHDVSEYLTNVSAYVVN
jgi:NitT/TauT family transport system substrate-binding protein